MAIGSFNFSFVAKNAWNIVNIQDRCNQEIQCIQLLLSCLFSRKEINHQIK
ncbi:hypothetical protein O166_05095 [Pseudogulbenkiania ferrooxidans EGD-HP2]|uniref:Uncharacterized protein n=1 Tax=Pseudogulbenkiania ferrooxidans EGD-HP2 TaxID=1388764 RepID=A0ABP2XR75_9NEIS|nr:hypothetical protein O166_05095 [Pseudogulbenkiania ferrooxidans EGD-HP2]